MRLVEVLKTNPLLFDLAKKWSRRLGRVNPLYLRLASEPRLQHPISFVQVGANDGISCDPIREFVVRYHWKGIAVEPVPAAYSILKRSYARYPSVTPLNCAVSYSADRTLMLSCVAESALTRYPPHASMISAADPLHLRRLLPSITPDDILQIAVDCMTVEEILDENDLQGVDLLQMDVEGHEPNILLNLDFSRVNAKYILFEHCHLSAEDYRKIEGRLRDVGYELEMFTSDTLGVRRA